MNTNEITNKFSLQDLLAYLFPGVFGLFAVYLFLKDYEVTEITNVSKNLFYSVNFFIGSFILGILFSGLSHPIVNLFYKLTKLPKPEETIPTNVNKEQLNQAFESLIGFSIKEKEWCSNYFYLSRNLVYEKMPVSSSIIFRQGGLRLIRQYLLIPIIIWIAYFVNLVLPILNENICSGVIFISGILILGFLLIRNLLFRMHKNRKREVDYVLLSMIALPNIKNDYTYES